MQHMVKAIEWVGAGLRLLDQRALPEQECFIDCADWRAVEQAIRTMVVRGAPAIGITAAYGMALAARDLPTEDPWLALDEAAQGLALSRPTAVNLGWALARQHAVIAECRTGGASEDLFHRLLAQAQAIHAEDIQANQTMGHLGADLIRQRLKAGERARVLTHCNAGALATGGFGTALGVIRQGWSEGLIEQVFADETRPWLQGGRLTAYELAKDNIGVTLIADVAAAHIMATRGIHWVIVGADRIAANGDTANKIGTYGLAILARYHGARLMVVAPTSTIDLNAATGHDIPIEDREADEVRQFRGQWVAPRQVAVANPVFDVTPAALIDVIVTEKGVIEAPGIRGIGSLFGQS
ncbi:MAG: S-methyl-5-thioribose-1-phosphate isomerase [Hahellaceae bacterium]|nr:S-methyl-5-thioribose-1-phosphate isomerase [Hahellaceae bacterium]